MIHFIYSPTNKVKDMQLRAIETMSADQLFNLQIELSKQILSLENEARKTIALRRVGAINRTIGLLDWELEKISLRMQHN